MGAEREFKFDDQDFSFLSGLVKQRTGIVLADHKRNMVYSRLARRLRELKMREFSDYCSMLQNEHGNEEIGNLINSITTNLTHFFREPHHFEHLRDEVFKPFFAPTNKNKRMRIWSAGCSSGAEPYSIAMVLENFARSATGHDCRILATDIDTNMLNRGKSGIYSAEMAERIPKPYDKYFTPSSQHASDVEMADSVKRHITFNQLNLMDTWPMKGPFDVIFCRNVVIYFDKDTQRQLFDRMADLLTPNGWLYIGHSESLNKVSDRFTLQGRTIYRRTS